MCGRTPYALNKIKRDSTLNELQNMLAAKVQTSMENTAPLRLAELQKKHQHKKADGTSIV